MHPTDPVIQHFRLLEPQKRALKKLGIETIGDILRHFPSRYENVSQIKNIRDLVKDDDALIYARVSNLKTRKAFRSKTPIAEATAEDATGKIKVIWFNQPYIAKMVPEGTALKMRAKVTGGEKGLYLANPEIERTDHLPIDVHETLFKKEDPSGSIFPVYPESRGITSKWFYHAILKIFRSGILDSIDEILPEDILARYNLPKVETAIVWLHTPKKEADAEAARKRFAFEEVFVIQLTKAQERIRFQSAPSFTISADRTAIGEFTKRFPFSPTRAQQRAIEDILSDFEAPHAMARLLEGDVGSGKTAVAATTCFAISTTHPRGQDFGNLQTAYMVPTEILAKQHFESFIAYFSHLPIQIGLITSSGCKKFPSKVDPTQATDISRAQLLKWVANGEIPILIGTHALIQKSVQFENLAYVIIDEQHRFGTLQRKRLVRKDAIVPHLLSMTATPIPRTLALTIYGDLDLTLLDEMPEGRKQIKTEIVTPVSRNKTYEKIRTELKEGRQAYVICPRIDEPDPSKEQALLAKSVKEEAKRLKKEVFAEYEIDILHSKMTPKEKEEVMGRFASGDIDILVATSVVEVGVNVPNATVILIEGAERFGLAQLHQLRGRVLRSSHQAYCFAFAETKSKKTIERLKALTTAKNGFELAEFDLSIRGAGELYGRKQWGISDVAMEAIKNIKMVEAARTEAYAIIEQDADLTAYPTLKTAAAKKTQELHFE